MIVAVPSVNPVLESPVSPVFGRSPYFMIAELVDTEIKNFKAVQNQALTQPSGLGIASAQLIANNKAEAVIANSIGPKAFSILQQFGVKPYQAIPATVRENLVKFAKGELQEIIPGYGPGRFGPGFGRGYGRGYGRGWRGPPGAVP